MASLRHERTVSAPASVVWDLIRDPASIPTWFPGVTSCVVEGNRRTLLLASGLSVPEEIMTIDPLTRRFAYRIVGPLYRFHLGTIDAIALSGATSLCVYSTTAEPDALALIMAGGTIAALEEIKRQAEAKAA